MCGPHVHRSGERKGRNFEVKDTKANEERNFSHWNFVKIKRKCKGTGKRFQWPKGQRENKNGFCPLQKKEKERVALFATLVARPGHTSKEGRAGKNNDADETSWNESLERADCNRWPSSAYFGEFDESWGDDSWWFVHGDNLDGWRT